MLAFVLVQLKDTHEKTLMSYFRKLKQVKEAHLLFGEWDCLLKVEVANENALGTFVIEKLRKKTGIESTSTMIVAK